MASTSLVLFLFGGGFYCLMLAWLLFLGILILIPSRRLLDLLNKDAKKTKGNLNGQFYNKVTYKAHGENTYNNIEYGTDPF